MEEQKKKKMSEEELELKELDFWGEEEQEEEFAIYMETKNESGELYMMSSIISPDL